MRVLVANLLIGLALLACCTSSVRVSGGHEAIESGSAHDPPCDLLGAAQLQLGSQSLQRRHGSRIARQRRAKLIHKDPESEQKSCPASDNGEAESFAIWYTRLKLQIDWLASFLLFLLGCVVYIYLTDSITPTDNQDLASFRPRGFCEEMMHTMWANTWTHSALDAVTVVLGSLNFYTYAVRTERIHEADYILLGMPLDKSGPVIETCGLIFFTATTVVRLLFVSSHPKWKGFWPIAVLRYSLCDICMILELIGLAVTFRGYFDPSLGVFSTAEEGYLHANFLCLFLVRCPEMLERSGAGLGMKRLKHLVTDDGKLLLVASVIGLAIWLVMSGLYFIANRENCNSLWEPAENFAPAPKGWQRFQSIPSSMWYVLINLLKEHPLADVHTTYFQRLLVVIVCIFAMPLFALPTAILQYALFKRAGEPGESQAALRGQEQQQEERQENSRKSMREGLAIFVLSMASILTYFYYTARETEHSTIFVKIPIHVSERTLFVVDRVVAAFFFCEFAYRFEQGGCRYLGSMIAVIDILAWLPTACHLGLFHSLSAVAHELLFAACVFRIFKLERYLHSYSSLIQVVVENSSILIAALLCSMLSWLFFSLLLYLRERENVDKEMSEDVYGSVLRSMWAEIINLHGEWPWADYTPSGKAIGTVIGLFSIMLFCVPISILSTGFQSKIESDRVDHSGGTPWQASCRPASNGFRQNVYDLLYGRIHSAVARSSWSFQAVQDSMPLRVMKAVSILMVVAGTMVTILSTVENLDCRNTSMPMGRAFWVMDVVATAWFLIEFTLRTVATSCRYPASLPGLCDLLSLLAFAYTLNRENREDAFRPDYKDDIFVFDSIVVIRLLRVSVLENYFFAFHTLRCVVLQNAWPLARAAGSLLPVWFTFATLLYIFENPKLLGAAPEPAEEDEMTMAKRYRSVLSSLQYAAVHLFGDYPETDYVLHSKILHFFGIMFGIAIIASFCGTFSSSFVSYLEREKQQDIAQHSYRSFTAMALLKIHLKRALATRRAKRARGEALPDPRRMFFLRRLLREIACGHTAFGKGVNAIFNWAVIVSLLNTMVMSLPEVDSDPLIERCSLYVEVCCTMIFLTQYSVRFMTRPRTLLSFWGIMDLICCLPGVVIVVKGLSLGLAANPDLERIMEALSMLRAARIINFQMFHREVHIIGRVLKRSFHLLGIPAYLALTMWIVSSSLFMWFEHEWQDEGGQSENMSDLPSAMYWCAIFLTGEWAEVDFTYAGSRLCIFYVLVGITIFSMPIGILVESVQSTLEMISVEDEATRKLLKLSSSNLGETFSFCAPKAQ